MDKGMEKGKKGGEEKSGKSDKGSKMEAKGPKGPKGPKGNDTAPKFSKHGKGGSQGPKFSNKGGGSKGPNFSKKGGGGGSSLSGGGAKGKAKGIMVVARDIIILVGAIAYHFVTRQLEMRPLFISKFNTAMQIALILLIALVLADIHVAPWLLNGMIAIVAISTLLSGISYVYLWSRYTVEAKKG